MTTSYYSVAVDLREKTCLVVGGGNIAERKVTSLLDNGGKVTVVSPELTDYLAKLVEDKKISYLKEKYQEKHLEGVFLVISATDSKEANREVARDCLERRILINAVDDPEYCSFIVPAVVRRGDLTISISTGGKSPALARRIRENLEQEYGDEYGVLLARLGEIRKEVLRDVPNQKQREQIFNCLATEDLIELIRTNQKDKLEERIKECLSLPLD